MILRAALQDRGKRGEKALSCSQRTEERQLRLAQRENFFPHSNDTCFAVSSEEEAHHRRLSLVERGLGTLAFVLPLPTGGRKALDTGAIV